MLRAAPGPAKLALFRESVPQHFPHTTNGTGLYEDRTQMCEKRRCARLSAGEARRKDWRNQILSEEVQATGFPEQQLVSLDFLRELGAELKKGAKSKATCVDCTHHCYHPRLGAMMLDHLWRRVLNWATSSSPAIPKTRESS